MDVGTPGAAVEPWIAFGVVLGIAALLLTGVVALLVARRRTAADRAAAAPGRRWPDDDLPGFRAAPPGPTGRPGGEAVVPLAAASPRPPARPAPPSVRSVAVGAAVLLLLASVVVAAVAAAVSGEDGGAHRSGPADHRSRPGDAHRDGPDRGNAGVRLSFEGIVLEERAVGVTVTYPELVLDGGVASLTLPTWNCLASEAPEDPVDAGCASGRTEYAQLESPDLAVTRTGDGLVLRGEFATSTRSGSGTTEPTGRSYRLEVTVAPAGGTRPGRWAPASGELDLGGRHAASVDGELRLGR